ncbi:helix-turn-helix domain-containing protein [Bombilactobacillus folatiphilus]|uniref:Helix-turn-helix domain-containing protein n=1 Tax=Bombilactobacillus folatiphilus TaxID=2923362 RepID=A0ABY4P852_9LACO|nr:Rgg/GadR/MutR family transcriptional regulator [Bombilactobacillus folatiphilus]UQS81776.1 helix-turn-helix domain-containing protein [Bombilactobacillus folatiphilus]
MEHGQLIRKLRKERNMSQAELAEGISSRTALSSFENKHSTISSDILFKYLERLNVTVQEYEFYLNDNVTPEKAYISEYFYNKVTKERDKEIAQRIHNFRAKYNDSHDFYFCCLSIELKLFLNRRNNKAIYQVDEDKQIIKDYLNHNQNWGHFEIALFSNCLYIFSSDYIRGTFPVLLKRTKKLSSIASYQNDLSIFLNNCIVLSFERQNFDDVNYYIDRLITISANTPRKAYDRMMCQYYLSLLQKLNYQPNQLATIIQQFNELGFTDHANELIKFKKQILKETKKTAKIAL